MDILHVNNQASVARLLSRAQAQLGHRSDLLAVPHPSQMGPDMEAGSVLRLYSKLLRIAPRYDLIHVHGGIGISGLGLLPYKVFGKRFFAHYHGSEIRMGKQTSFHSLAETLFVSTPDLLAFRERVGGRELVHVPNPVDIHDASPEAYPERLRTIEEGGRFLVAHMPSLRSVKGTQNVVKAVAEANAKGGDLELDIIENVTHGEAMERLSRAHLCVDWMSPDYRIYGVVSIEAMARGIPTICNVDPALYTEDLPVVPAGPERLSDVLIELSRSVERLAELSRLSAGYARAHHSPMVCARIIESYL